MNKQEAARLVGVLSAAYPGKPIPHETVQLYVAMLQDLDAQTTAEAVANLVRTRTFWPAIAEIRDEYAGIIQQRRQRTPRLPEPDVTPAQRKQNLTRVRQLTASIGRPI